ncbi:LysR substrate-binding domain-containing protein [Chitinibacteraceae bacterium HSL-7]
MRPLPPLPALRAFEAVARLGSVTRAADELHLTHSAVSHQIKQLEGLLESGLFVRSGKRLQLTEAGRIYALQVRHALASLARATSEMQFGPRPQQLVVATLPSFGCHWLLPRLPRLYQRHPSCQLYLNTTLAFIDLEQERIDCAVRMGAGHWEGMEQQQLFRDQLIVVASPHFNEGRLPSSAGEVERAPRIFGAGISWQSWFNLAGLEETCHAPPLWLNDANLVIEATLQGQGLALLRRSIAHQLLQDGRLRQITDLVVDYPDPYWLIWPPRHAAKITHFREWLVDEVRQYQHAE